LSRGPAAFAATALAAPGEPDAENAQGPRARVRPAACSLHQAGFSTPGWPARRFRFPSTTPNWAICTSTRDFKEGVDGSICSYRYDPSDARRTIAHRDRPCRINSYGNSFTSCEQVSDGETWQEFFGPRI